MAINAFNDSYVVVYCAVLSFSVIMRAIEHNVRFHRKSQRFAAIFLQSADLSIVMRNNSIIFSPGKSALHGRIVLLVCKFCESSGKKSIVKLSRTVNKRIRFFKEMLRGLC